MSRLHQPLRRPLLTMAGAIVLLVFSICWGWYPYQRGRLALGAETRHWLELQQRYRRESNERVRLDQALDDYWWLQKHHALGEEKRLEWVEALAREDRDPRLALHYSIEPQRVFEWQSRTHRATAPYLILASRMMLHVEALHEGPWLDVLDRLESDAPGLYGVHECRATRKFDADTASLPLKIDCMLDWFSIAPRTGVRPLVDQERTIGAKAAAP